MAAANYDEVSHTNTTNDWNTLDPLYRWDTHFPERLSRLHMHEELIPTQASSASAASARRQRRGRNRHCSRFKTQPITFDEIKEVDEEGSNEDYKRTMKDQFAAFSRSMDGLLPGLPNKAAAASAGAADSEKTTNCDHKKSPSPLAMDTSPACTEVSATAGPDHLQSETSDSSPSSSSSTSGSASGLPAGLPQQDLSRARRMKRRVRKSIEEEPELEKEAAIATQEAG